MNIFFSLAGNRVIVSCRFARLSPSAAYAYLSAIYTCTCLCSDLSNNAFYGSLPPVWSNLTSLELVDISHNKLTGPLPAAFSAWDAMQVRYRLGDSAAAQQQRVVSCTTRHCSGIMPSRQWCTALTTLIATVYS
jgi:hypothetical protein